MVKVICRIIFVLIATTGSLTLRAQVVVESPESYNNLSKHIGKLPAERLQYCKKLVKMIKEQPSAGIMKNFSIDCYNKGLSEHQIDSLNFLLNNIYINVYSALQSRDVLRYQNPYQQKGFVELYDSISGILNSLYPYTFSYNANRKGSYDEYLEIWLLSGINQVVCLTLYPDRWKEQILVFSELTYNTVTITRIPDDAKDGLGGHSQITKIDLYYNENQQVSMDVGISLENSQNIFEGHYVVEFGTEKDRKEFNQYFFKTDTRLERIVRSFKDTPRYCFCNAEEYCPITYLINSSQTDRSYLYPVSDGYGVNIFNGDNCFPYVDVIKEIGVGFTEYHWYPDKAAFDNYIKLDGLELIPTGWEYIWYPDGRMFSKNFYLTPYFPEEGRYGKPESTGLVINNENVFEDDKLIGMVGVVYNRFGKTIINESPVDGRIIREQYYIIEDTIIRKNHIYYNSDGTIDTVYTGFSDNVHDFMFVEASLLFGKHWTGITWPLKKSKNKDSLYEEKKLYHIKSDENTIFIPLR